MSQWMGSRGPTTGRETADKLKERFEWLQSFTDDELREISYCNTPESMRSGELYFDISHPEKGVIQGQDGETIPEDSCYVVKSEVPRRLWDKLTAPYR